MNNRTVYVIVVTVYVIVVLLVLLVLFTANAAAQETTETPTPRQSSVMATSSDDNTAHVPSEVFGAQAVDEITPADEAARTLLDMIYAIVYIPIAAPLILILVNLMKSIPLFNRFSSQMLAFVWNAVIWIIFTLLNEAGYGGYFESVLGTITTVATLLLGIFGSQMAAGKLYSVARERDMAVLGYQRNGIDSNSHFKILPDNNAIG